MNPTRNVMPIQIAPLVTVSPKACASPVPVSCTAPICDIPRFSIRSPALAHTTIAKTMTSVLIRSLLSFAILRGLVVSGSRRRSGHGDHGLIEISALLHPLQALRTELQEFRRFGVQALALVAVPQRFFHDAPHNLGPEVILIVEAIHTRHHLRLGKVRILDVRQLMAAG